MAIIITNISYLMEVLTMDKKLIEEKIAALVEVRDELNMKLRRENRKANSTESSVSLLNISDLWPHSFEFPCKYK
jgi:hypothetical protein